MLQIFNIRATANRNNTVTQGSIRLLTLFTYLITYGSGIFIRSHMSVQSILFVSLQSYHSHMNILLHVSEVQIITNQVSITESPPIVAEVIPTPDQNEKVGKGAGKTNEKDTKAGKTGKDSKGGKISTPEPVIELPPVVVEPVKLEPVIEEKKPVDITAHLSETEKWLLNKQITYDDFLLLLNQILCSVLYIDRVDPSVFPSNSNTNDSNNQQTSELATTIPASTIPAVSGDVTSVTTNGTVNLSARATATITTAGTVVDPVDYASRLLVLQSFDNSESHSNEQDHVYIPTLANPHSATTVTIPAVTLNLSVAKSPVDLLPVRSLAGHNNTISYNREVITFKLMKERLERWKNITSQEMQYY